MLGDTSEAEGMAVVERMAALSLRLDRRQCEECVDALYLLCLYEHCTRSGGASPTQHSKAIRR